MKPRLIIQQKITAFANRYRILATDNDGEPSELVAFAQQKRIAFQEKVWFYDDENKSNEIFSFRAEKVLDVHGKYFVEDTSGQIIGMFRKNFKQSLLRSTWVIMDQNGKDMFVVTESNAALAFFRRFIGWIPYVGGILEIITNFLKYHFVFSHVGTGMEIGAYEKTTLFRDHYLLSMADEAYEVTDWRVLAAMGVALDALQSR